MKRSRFSAAFARAIRRARLAAKLTQEELAEVAGVHPVYVSMVERGESIPTIEVAYRMACALSKNLSAIVAAAERATRGQT
jgi:transcriptional regulator with XRE-family HTH domain